jgi:hypothetical protein
MFNSGIEVGKTYNPDGIEKIHKQQIQKGIQIACKYTGVEIKRNE